MTFWTYWRRKGVPSMHLHAFIGWSIGTIISTISEDFEIPMSANIAVFSAVQLLIVMVAYICWRYEK